MPPSKIRPKISADPRVWEIYAAVCEHRGEQVSTRIASVLIPADIRAHGTASQIAEMEAALADQPRRGPEPRRPGTPAQELREWAERRDEGLISEEEYQQVKARLLLG